MSIVSRNWRSVSASANLPSLNNSRYSTKQAWSGCVAKASTLFAALITLPWKKYATFLTGSLTEGTCSVCSRELTGFHCLLTVEGRRQGR